MNKDGNLVLEILKFYPRIFARTLIDEAHNRFSRETHIKDINSHEKK